MFFLWFYGCHHISWNIKHQSHVSDLVCINLFGSTWNDDTFFATPSSTGRWLFVRLANLGDSWRNASRKTRGVFRSQVFFSFFLMMKSQWCKQKHLVGWSEKLRFGQLEKEWEVSVVQTEKGNSWLPLFFAAELRGGTVAFCLIKISMGDHVGWNDDLQIFILGYVWCSLLLRCGFRVHSVDLSRVLWFEFSCVANELNAN